MAQIGKLPSIGGLIGDLIYGKYDLVAMGDNAATGTLLGESICDFDTFSDIEVDLPSESVSVPIEGGSFVSYNKVMKPAVINVTMMCQATITGLVNQYFPNTRIGFLENAVKTLQRWRDGMRQSTRDTANDWRVVLVLPSDVFVGYAVTRVNVPLRAGRSPTLLPVSVTLQQVMEAPSRVAVDPQNEKRKYIGMKAGNFLR